MIPIIYRQMIDTDFGFVYNSFLQGARIPLYSHVLPPVYYRRYKPILKSLIARSQVLIACLPDDPNTIAGFIVHDKFDNFPIIHWVHVRSVFQKQGMSQDIIKQIAPSFQESLTLVSHMPNPTKDSPTFHQLKKKYNLQYDPFLIYP